MHKTLTLYASVLCILFSASVVAQSHIIKGTVNNSEGKGIAGATVTLLKAADSTWVQSEITEDSGSFVLDEIPAGNYIVAMTAIGYSQKEQIVAVNNKDITVNILAERSSNILDEVTVTGNKPLIEREPGKTIINVSSEKAAGENVLDLMRKLPGITVSGTGEVNMTGKQGVLVLVNGKKTYLSGDDLANYLRSMSAEQVAQVEVMSQPSAKYDAEGNTGIINIKVRKNEKEGLSGTASARYSRTAFNGTSENLRINYKKKKTGLVMHAGYYNNAGFLAQETYRNFRDLETNDITGTFSQETYLRERFWDYSLGIDAEHEINDKTSISLHTEGVYHPNRQTDKSNAVLKDESGTITYNEFINQRAFVRKHYNIATRASHKITDGHEVTMDADYLTYDIPHTQDMVNRNYDEQKQPIPGGIILRGTQPTTITVYSAKADYNGKINDKTKVEAGIKTSVLHTRNGVFFDINNNGAWHYDSTRSNDFLYDEQINSSYISFNRTLSKKLETKVGLRAEQTHSVGLQKVGNRNFDRQYISLFPTAFVSYKLNENYNCELNIGRRIQRPGYRQMNPYIEYNSQYKYNVGNPFLRPTYSVNTELSVNYKNTLNATLQVNSVNDIISYVARQDNSNYTYYVMPENIAKFTEQQFGLTFNKELYKWWEASATAYGFGIQYEGVYNQQPFDVSGWGYGMHMSGTIKIFEKWKTEYWLNAVGRSQETSMSVASPYVLYGFGLSRKLFHDTTLVKFNIIDPFHTYAYNFSMRMQDIDTQITNRYNTMEYALTISYDFGKQLDRIRQISSSSDETGRMKM